MIRFGFATVAVIFIALIFLPLSAPLDAGDGAAVQSSLPQTDLGVAIKVSVDSVLLNISVVDRITNRSIRGLRTGDFLVYEDDVLQDVEQMLPVEAPFNLLLLLDASGSTAPYIKLMKEAATEFTAQIRDEDKVAVAAFNSRVRLLADFTGDRGAAARAIGRIHSGGGTAFYDALMTCVDDYMRGLEGRKAIVVFTDGIDNQLYGDRRDGSVSTFEELFRRIQERDILIYTIFLDGEGQPPVMTGPVGRIPRRSGLSFPFPLPLPIPFPGSRREEQAAYQIAREQLEDIAGQTGGRMYSPRRANDLAEAYAQVADDLRVQYLVAYSSSNHAHDNRWRSIRVEIRNRPEAVVRTRKGYYAGIRSGLPGK